MWDLSKGEDDLRIAINAGSSDRPSDCMSTLEHQGVLIADTEWPAPRRSRGVPDQSLRDRAFVGGDDDLWIDSLADPCNGCMHAQVVSRRC